MDPRSIEQESNSPNFEEQRRNANWRKVDSGLSIAAEFFNSVIVIDIIGKWIPSVALFFVGGPLGLLLLVGDQLIYLCRLLIRLTRLIGRNFLNVKFEEDEHGPPHKLQPLGDLLSLCCFALAIVFFAGALIAPPVGITLAWAMGLCGLGFISFFDYIWPEKQAKQKCERLAQDPHASEQEKIDAQKAYKNQKYSRRLFLTLLLGLSLLLVCGSAAAFAPPLLVPVLLITSKAASIFLGGVACFRFYHWYNTRPKKAKLTHAHRLSQSSLSLDLSASSSPAPSPSHSRNPSHDTISDPAFDAPSPRPSLRQRSVSVDYLNEKSHFSYGKDGLALPSSNGLFGLHRARKQEDQTRPAEIEMASLNATMQQDEPSEPKAVGFSPST